MTDLERLGWEIKFLEACLKLFADATPEIRGKWERDLAELCEKYNKLEAEA